MIGGLLSWKCEHCSHTYNFAENQFEFNFLEHEEKGCPECLNFLQCGI